MRRHILHAHPFNKLIAIQRRRNRLVQLAPGDVTQGITVTLVFIRSILSYKYITVYTGVTIQISF